MKLKVLVDNNTFIDQYYFGEPAWCCYIEESGKKILLDAGYSDIFLKNAELMGINLGDISTLVISHGHNDHTWGMPYLFDRHDMSKVDLVAAPGCFDPKRFENLEIGSPFSKDELAQKVNLIETDIPYDITDNLVFLGTIPDIFDFEKRLVIGEKQINGKWIEDTNMEDSALALKTDKGLVIITACSHSGICNITEYAKEVCDDKRIRGVIGGFHLFDVDERLEKTTDYLAAQNPEFMYPAHCVSLAAKIYMSKKLPVGEVGVNFELNID